MGNIQNLILIQMSKHMARRKSLTEKLSYIEVLLDFLLFKPFINITKIKYIFGASKESSKFGNTTV